MHRSSGTTLAWASPSLVRVGVSGKLDIYISIVSWSGVYIDWNGRGGFMGGRQLSFLSSLMHLSILWSGSKFRLQWWLLVDIASFSLCIRL